MQPELTLKTISHTAIAISFTAILVVLLIALRREISHGTIPTGVVHLCLAIMGIFAFIPLATIYFHARRIVLPYSVSHHLDTAAVSDRRPVLMSPERKVANELRLRSAGEIIVPKSNSYR